MFINMYIQKYGCTMNNGKHNGSRLKHSTFTSLAHSQVWHIHKFDTFTSLAHSQVWHIHKFGTFTSLAHLQVWHIYKFGTFTSLAHSPHNFETGL